MPVGLSPPLAYGSRARTRGSEEGEETEAEEARQK